MEFIEKYAKVDGSSDDEMFDAGDEEIRNNSDDDFIENEFNFQDQDQPSDYRMMNVTRGLQEA